MRAVAEVLVVEDDVDTADAIANMLRDAGHRVRIACDGKQGLRLLEQAVPDLVLLDIEMPVLGGREMAIAMSAPGSRFHDVPVLFVSGSPDLVRTAVDIGTPYFLAKPCRDAPLLELINRALRERRAPTPPAAR
jgi:CheY-like chemotaxis protein